jgi:hypothetical protein
VSIHGFSNDKFAELEYASRCLTRYVAGWMDRRESVRDCLGIAHICMYMMCTATAFAHALAPVHPPSHIRA